MIHPTDMSFVWNESSIRKRKTQKEKENKERGKRKTHGHDFHPPSEAKMRAKVFRLKLKCMQDLMFFIWLRWLNFFL